MKNVKILALTALMAVAQGLRAEAPKPFFTEKGVIQVGDNFMLCGRLTITPIPVAKLNPSIPVSRQFNTLWVRAVHYRFDGSVATKGEAKLPIEGQSFSYAHAGVGDAPHFDIIVFTKDSQGNEIPLNAKDYVTIESNYHNGSCLSGWVPEHWAPLNMKD